MKMRVKCYHALIMASMISALFMACSATKNVLKGMSDIPFKEAKNYFLANDTSVVPMKITSQEEFDGYFGMAAFMGKRGEVTLIDFKKEFVIPIVPGETGTKTTISQIRLQGNKQEVHLHYVIKESEKQSYRIAPIRLLVVSNKYKDAEITVNAIR